ncbi:MAG: acyltransferase [Desulfamplus sp.]|nr:acyltransferase [Desulfamplus sp.]
MYIESKNFLPGLHALRGLAATVIIVYHLHLMQPVFKVHYLSFINTFGAGVTLFFMLSCFSLFHSTQNKIHQGNWLFVYVMKRIFRIYPLFLLMIGVHLILHYLLYDKVYSFAEILSNLLILYQFYPGQHTSFVWAGWTIGVEVTFYCLFPLLLVVSQKIRFWLALFLITMLLSRSMPLLVAQLKLDVSYGYMSFPSQLFVFIGGGLLYLIVNRYPINRRIALVLFFVFIVLIMFFKLISEILSIVVLLLGILIYSCYKSKFLFNNFTKFLGEASYSIYLLHPVVIGLLKPYVKNIYHTQLPVDICFLICFLIVFFLVCVIAYIINRYFEIPIYRYGIKLAKSYHIKPIDVQSC